jgi:hypothetical protein
MPPAAPDTSAPTVATACGRGDSIILSRVADFALQSGAFDHGGPIPRRHTARGASVASARLVAPVEGHNDFGTNGYAGPARRPATAATATASAPTARLRPLSAARRRQARARARPRGPHSCRSRADWHLPALAKLVQAAAATTGLGRGQNRPCWAAARRGYELLPPARAPEARWFRARAPHSPASPALRCRLWPVPPWIRSRCSAPEGALVKAQSPLSVPMAGFGNPRTAVRLGGVGAGVGSSR